MLVRRQECMETSLVTIYWVALNFRCVPWKGTKRKRREHTPLAEGWLPWYIWLVHCWELEQICLLFPWPWIQLMTSWQTIFIYFDRSSVVGLIRTVVSIVHCGCTDRSSILRLDRYFCDFCCCALCFSRSCCLTVCSCMDGGKDVLLPVLFSHGVESTRPREIVLAQ